MAEKSFDASKYLTNLNGREYLEVKWRLLWLRTEHADAVIQTELIDHRDGYALFKARVLLPTGGEATGWGSETAEDFEDYLEAAETKALGRALAALGYGTQFCEDFEFREEGKEGLVDAPVVSGRARKSSARPRGAKATEAQVNALYTIARQVYNWHEEELSRRCQEHFGRPPRELTKAEASRFIDDLKAKKLHS